MEKVTQKKVLFLITKSNWGEKVSKHFRKTLPSIFGENGDKAETELLFCFRRLPAIFAENSDNLYSICKMYRACKAKLRRPTV